MSILCLTPRRTQLCFALQIQLFHPIQASRLLFGGDKSSNRVGQPCTARNTVGRPTGSANRARPGTQSAGQLGRPTVHGQEHGRPSNRVAGTSLPTGSANRARPGTRSAVQPGRRTVHGQEHGQPANRVGQPGRPTVYGQEHGQLGARSARSAVTTVDRARLAVMHGHGQINFSPPFSEFPLILPISPISPTISIVGMLFEKISKAHRRFATTTPALRKTSRCSVELRT